MQRRARQLYGDLTRAGDRTASEGGGRGGYLGLATVCGGRVDAASDGDATRRRPEAWRDRLAVDDGSVCVVDCNLHFATLVCTVVAVRGDALATCCVMLSMAHWQVGQHMLDWRLREP